MLFKLWITNGYTFSLSIAILSDTKCLVLRMTLQCVRSIICFYYFFTFNIILLLFNINIIIFDVISKFSLFKFVTILFNRSLSLYLNSPGPSLQLYHLLELQRLIILGIHQLIKALNDD